ASMYGVKIVTDQEDSPHLLLDQVQGELYYAFAEVDAHVPDHVIPDLSAALEKAGTAHEVQVFPGTEHGFQFAERAVYAPVAAEEAWEKLFALWERRLK
ncbi:MAG: dienelactone hydrolase family protein, partial [Rhodospirillaceae bacterium]|nr:dienelactone hydrolase family protein [Rhodospirillaceae bacterium]